MSVIPFSASSAQTLLAESTEPTVPTAPVPPDLDALSGWFEVEELIPSDLSVVSTRELRVLCNELYSALDLDFPPYGAHEAYSALVSELEEREVWAHRQP